MEAPGTYGALGDQQAGVAVGAGGGGRLEARKH